MIKEVIIHFDNGNKYTITSEEDQILRAVWLKRHDIFKIVNGKGRIYYPAKNIDFVEVLEGENTDNVNYGGRLI